VSEVESSSASPAATGPIGPRPRPRGPSVLVVPVLLVGVVALIIGVSVSGASAAKKRKTEVATTAPVTAEHDHGTQAIVAPKAYDPQAKGSTKVVDLSGVPGVTPAEQSRAEKLVAVTLKELPQFATQAAAEAKGFHSIHDGATGFEHLINWDYINDDHTLDPNYPESLVYATGGGTPKLVSAMFMLKTGETLDTVPDVGGPLTQWHIHDNLCFSNDGGNPVVAGLTLPDGSCRAPLQKLTPVPMLHVWIVKNACGPFAALEGVGAGQIKPGEKRACDTVHSH